MYDIMRCVTLFVSDAVDYELFVIEQFHVVLNIFYVIAFISTSSASPSTPSGQECAVDA